MVLIIGKLKKICFGSFGGANLIRASWKSRFSIKQGKSSIFGKVFIEKDWKIYDGKSRIENIIAMDSWALF